MVLRDIAAGASADEAAELNRVPVEKVREWVAFYELELLQRSPLTIRDGQQAREEALHKLAAAHSGEFAALLEKECAALEAYRATPMGREQALDEWRDTPQWRELLKARARAASKKGRS